MTDPGLVIFVIGALFFLCGVASVAEQVVSQRTAPLPASGVMGVVEVRTDAHWASAQDLVPRPEAQTEALAPLFTEISTPDIPPGAGAPLPLAPAETVPVVVGAPRTARVVSPGFRLRENPSVDGEILRTVAPGTLVEVSPDVVEHDGERWARVRLPDGAEGWMASAGLE